MKFSLRELAPLILLLAAGTAYANSLSGAFVIDDRASIVHNETIRDLGDLAAIWKSAPDSPVAGRPVVNLTFAINYAIGGFDVAGYHAVNIGIHLLCGLLVFLLLGQTLRSNRVTQDLPTHQVRIAFATALIWLVHPLNSEVVVYLSQRTESLAALLILGVLCATVRAAESGPDSTAVAWTWVAIGCCWLGVFTKELIAVVPILALAYDRVFLSGSWTGALQQRRVLYIGLFGSWIPLASMLARGSRDLSVGFDLGVSAWAYLLNQALFLVRYLRLSIWPDSLVAFYGWPKELTLAQVWPQAAIVLLLFGATLVALSRRPKPLGFLGLWFFVLLAPTSSVLPIITEVAAERRMYLPLIAVLLPLVLLATWLVREFCNRLLAGGGRLQAALEASLLLLVCVPLTMTTMQRNAEYRSELALAETLVDRWPTGVAHQIYGMALMRDGAEDEGLEQLQRAVREGNSRAGAALARALFDAGELDEALGEAERFLATAEPGARPQHPWLRPDSEQLVLALSTRAQVLTQQQAWEQVEEDASRALELDPSHAQSRILLADALFAQQRWTQAQLEYRRYLRANPDNAAAWINLGIAEVGRERPLEARAAFERAVDVAPDDGQARLFLSMILWQLQDLDGASEHAAVARDLGVRDPVLDQILGGSIGARRPGVKR